MNNSAPSRAERRRAVREGRPLDGEPTAARPSSGQWPLALAISGFFFLCAAVALIQGMELWSGQDILSKGVGWGGLVVAAGAAFGLWRRTRARFAWKARWTVLLPIALIGGIVGALLWTMSIQQWNATRQLSHTLERHHEVVQKAEQWLPGQAWTPTVCTQQQDKRMALAQDLFRRSTPPFPLEVEFLLRVQQVSYQAGCSDTWGSLKEFMLNTPSQWTVEHPVQLKALLSFLNERWPNAYQGCQMEQARFVSMHPAQDAEAFSLVCARVQSSSVSVWAPGQFLTQANTLIEELNTSAPQK